MSGKIEIEFINEGFLGILKGEGVKQILEEKASAVANAAGEGFSYDILLGNTRYNALIHSDTEKAAKEEAENKILSIALNAAGG